MAFAFFSYSSADREFAYRLKRLLENEGVRVWIDEASLRVGDPFRERIKKAIEEVQFVVALLSERSIRSPWVQLELELGLSREKETGQPKILPVLIANCEIPPELSNRIFADLSTHETFYKGFGKLLVAMGSERGKDYVESDGAPTQHRKTGISIAWTQEGPRIIGNDVPLTATEANAVLNRWHKNFPVFLRREKMRHGKEQDAVEAARLLATIRACGDTYGQIPDEQDMSEMRSELSRKFDLFYKFLVEMEADALE